MSAAAVEVPVLDEASSATAPMLARQQAADVLAAHRSRRQRTATERSQDNSSLATQGNLALPSRSQAIASRVTERYAQTQSYRAFLAAEAEEATCKANAVAEIAARTARAVAHAQQQLMHDLAHAETSHADLSQSIVPAEVEIVEQAMPQRSQPLAQPSAPAAEEHHAPAVTVSRAGLTVKLFEDAGSVLRSGMSKSTHPTSPAHHPHPADSLDTIDSEETRALDEEISFRQSPSFDLQQASVAIPGNLLEFPRHLVAARKARPRYAEGPLREEDHGHDQTQLRIFEVEASQITAQPPVESSTPEWSSIWLDALAEETPDDLTQSTALSARPRPEAASPERRVMACIVDACLVGMGFIVFATAFAYTAPVLPSLTIASISSVGALAAIFLIYHTLFFSLSEATPGMRYARIGLCTFAEENPRQAARLARIPATLLAACPLGLGFLWACLDDDGLGWHDRLSGMYQRSY